MNKKLKQQLKNLPDSPGVYIFRNKKNEIIYIGKAVKLVNRVKSYFSSSHNDYKTPKLVENIHSVEWTTVSSEIEALFLEAEYIKRHKPLYNVQQKDDKNFIFIRVSLQDEFPIVTVVRRPLDDKSRYYGPFVSSYQVKQALKYLRKIFPYYTQSPKSFSSKLEYQIGTLPQPNISKTEYRSNIRKLCLVLEGKSNYLITKLTAEMKKYSSKNKFESAAVLRNQIFALKALATKVTIADNESFELKVDSALQEMSIKFGLRAAPKRIECYDISNFAGGDSVSSMVVFTNGLPDLAEYRHFKMRTPGPNDFAMMSETIHRRFSTRNRKWPQPDLIMIDGGKGQLSVVLKELELLKINIPAVGLAKRYETIVLPHLQGGELRYSELNFEPKSACLHLLQRIRDEAHRFAVSYHITLRKKRTQKSALDDISGIGPTTKKQLLRHFGSVAQIRQASLEDLTEIVGKSRANLLYSQLR